MTARTLITQALRSLRVLGLGDDLQAEDANDALLRLNDWLDSLSLERLSIYYVVRTPVPLLASKGSYTIGVGGDIDMVRPNSIESAGLVLDSSADPAYEKPIDLFTDQRWQSIRQKNLTSPYIQGIYYDHNWSPLTVPPPPAPAQPLGTLYVWPVPNIASTRLILYTPQALPEFASLDTDYTFPPGYRRFLRTNLMAELAPEYGKQLTADQFRMATQARAVVKRANVRPVEARVDPALVRSGEYFDWRTGEPR
jgi:hypothetical protein